MIRVEKDGSTGWWRVVRDSRSSHLAGAGGKWPRVLHRCETAEEAHEWAQELVHDLAEGNAGR